MKSLILSIAVVLAMVGSTYAEVTLEEVETPDGAIQYVQNFYQRIGKGDNITVVNSSGFEARTLRGYDYLIAKIYVTVHSSGGQTVMGVVIDRSGDWTQVMTESDFRMFLRSGDRIFLHEPELDPNS
jgi:hypothetical protein